MYFIKLGKEVNKIKGHVGYYKYQYNLILKNEYMVLYDLGEAQIVSAKYGKKLEELKEVK